MSENPLAAGARTPSASDLLEQYGCGPVRFTGSRDALYERHLLFDNVVDPGAAGARDRFEAAAGSATITGWRALLEASHWRRSSGVRSSVSSVARRSSMPWL